MPKHTITFNLPEESAELERAIKATPMSIALDEIANDVFRPNRKHGYGNAELEKLRENEQVVEAIEILEDMFRQILINNNVAEGV